MGGEKMKVYEINFEGSPILYTDKDLDKLADILRRLRIKKKITLTITPIKTRKKEFENTEEGFLDEIIEGEIK